MAPEAPVSRTVVDESWGLAASVSVMCLSVSFC